MAKLKPLTIDVIHTIRDMKNYLVLERVPEPDIFSEALPGSTHKTITFLDTETTGLDYKKDEIIEIALLQVKWFPGVGYFVTNKYNGLQEPESPVSEEITKITGITNEDLVCKEIDWQEVNELLEESDYVIAHNAAFDRKFVEEYIGIGDKQIKWGCTKDDIDWRAQGVLANKLDYINWKLGYFYDAHRALTDCYATLNAVDKANAWQELIDSIEAPIYRVSADKAAFDTKDTLKARGYYWDAGRKVWYKDVKDLEAENIWLAGNVYFGRCMSSYSRITAYDKYSERG